MKASLPDVAGVAASAARSVRLGELLLAERLVTPTQLEEALRVQSRELRATLV